MSLFVSLQVLHRDVYSHSLPFAVMMPYPLVRGAVRGKRQIGPLFGATMERHHHLDSLRDVWMGDLLYRHCTTVARGDGTGS